MSIRDFFQKHKNSNVSKLLTGTVYIMFITQWGEQVFDTLPILQVFPLTKHVEVFNFVIGSLLFNCDWRNLK